MLNLFYETWKYICIFSHVIVHVVEMLSFGKEKGRFIIHIKCQGCWWPGKERRQGISIHGIYLDMMENSGLSTRRFRSLRPEQNALQLTYFQMHILEWKLLYFNTNFSLILSKVLIVNVSALVQAIATNARLWSFLCYKPEHTLEWTAMLPMIGYMMTLL